MQNTAALLSLGTSCLLFVLFGAFFQKILKTPVPDDGKLPGALVSAKSAKQSQRIPENAKMGCTALEAHAASLGSVESRPRAFRARRNPFFVFSLQCFFIHSYRSLHKSRAAPRNRGRWEGRAWTPPLLYNVPTVLPAQNKSGASEASGGRSSFRNSRHAANTH